MSIAKQYTTEISRALQYLPIWLPIKTLRLGSVGTIRNHVFELEGDLEAMQIPFSSSEGRPAGTMRYNSSKGVSFQLKAAGAAPVAGSMLTTADAGVVIKFSRANVVVFEAGDCQIEAIADIGALGQQLIHRYQLGKWDEDAYVVTEIVKAGSVTVLISSNAGATTELKVGGKVEAAALSLADVNAQFGLVEASDMGYHIVAEKGLTPLFKAWRVDPGFFKTSFKSAFLESDESEIEEPVTNIPVFSQMSVDDIWPSRTANRSSSSKWPRTKLK